MYQPDPLGSRSVDWWSVHTFVADTLAAAGAWPMAGTLEWQQLPDDHPAKWAALLDAAQHHALRVELAQEAQADAAKAVAAAADWNGIARELTTLNTYRASRPWTKRTAS